VCGGSGIGVGGLGGQQVLQRALSAPLGHTPIRLVSELNWSYMWNGREIRVDQINEYGKLSV
jgi:hypothetical protein